MTVFSLHPVPSNAISGLGTNVEKIVETCTGTTVAYLGQIDGRCVVYFQRPLPVATIFKIMQQFFNNER